MENIVFLIVVAIVGVVQLAMRVAEARKNAQTRKTSHPPATNAPIPRAPAESEEERVRRFFEALGVPTTSTPPPRVPPQPRQVTPKTPRPKRKIMPVDPFPVPRAGAPFPPVTASAPSIPPTPVAPGEPLPLPTREISVFADSPPAKPRPQLTAAQFEVRNIDESVAEDLPSSTQETAPATQTSKPRARSIVARLGTAEGLRDAMVLREIFGPPRSMQTLEQR